MSHFDYAEAIKEIRAASAAMAALPDIPMATLKDGQPHWQRHEAEVASRGFSWSAGTASDPASATVSAALFFRARGRLVRVDFPPGAAEPDAATKDVVQATSEAHDPGRRVRERALLEARVDELDAKGESMTAAELKEFIVKGYRMQQLPERL